jgi:hypothetical protein
MRQPTRRRPFVKPRLEALEDILAPSTMLWIDSAGDGLYNHSTNWVNTANAADQHIPTPSDNLLFDPAQTVGHSRGRTPAAPSA